jgi:hypothetical protein
LNKARTETKNWVRSARLRSARMDPDVRLGVFSFKSLRRWSKNDHPGAETLPAGAAKAALKLRSLWAACAEPVLELGTIY